MITAIEYRLVKYSRCLISEKSERQTNRWWKIYQ